MFYSPELIEEIRERNDIVDVISSYVRLNKKGGNYWGLCPFHGEKTPSFSVNGVKQTYHCFGCGAGGNVITFMMNYENLNFTESLKELADRAGMRIEASGDNEAARKKADLKTKLLEINKEAAKFFYFNLREERGRQGLDYFKDRGLTDKSIQSFGLGFAPKYKGVLYSYLKEKGYDDGLLKQSGLFVFDEKDGVYDKFWNRVMFPIMDMNNRVIGFGGRVMGDGKPKYLNSPETQIFNKRKNLYGLNFARHTRESCLIVCEGYMDVIALHQAGFTNSVATLGTALTQEQAGIISRYVKTVILVYDSDSAGTNAALRAVPIMKTAGIATKIARLEPYKDPDEFIKNLGREEFKSRLDAAVSSFDFETGTEEKKYDLSDPEEKTKFLNSLALKLLDIEEELERENYIDAISDKYGISRESFFRLVNKLGAEKSIKDEFDDTERKIKATDKKQTGADGILKSERLLLSWLTDRPELYHKIENIISPENFSEGLNREAARLLFTEIKEKGKANPAGIISRFENVEEQTEVSALFEENVYPKLSEDDFKRAFTETVVKIKKVALEAEMNTATEIGDMVRFAEIIKERSEISDIHIEV